MANKAVAVTERRGGPAAATTVAVSEERRQSRMDWGYALFLVPGLLAFLILIVIPVLANFAISFTRWTGVGTPTWVGLNNYAKALGDAIFWASFRNNLFLIVAMVII